MRKKTLFSIFFPIVFSLFGYPVLNAMVVGDPSNLVECMQALNGQDIDTFIDTDGFYHVGDGVLSIEKENLSYVNSTGIRNAYLSAWGYKCAKYTNIHKDISIAKVMPVYQPKKLFPIGFQAIFTKQGIFIESIFIQNGNKLHSPGFNYGEKEFDKNVYDISLTKPFVSAPMLQMYNYLGHPLLVARSSTGVVTDVYLQNRPNILNPMERAKKFLGKKWYTP